jgi:hypothetical protein
MSFDANSDAERKAFEAWALEKNYAYRNKHGLWFYEWSEPLWAGWQGGRAFIEPNSGAAVQDASGARKQDQPND